MHEFLFVLLGAGAVALAQNLGDYRVDTEFLEYVFDPVKHFVIRLFGVKSVAKLEAKGKAIVHDAAAKLDNLVRAGEKDGEKLLAEVQKIVGEIKAKL